MKPVEDIEVQISIPVKRYRTDAGVPTCARNFSESQVCPFLAILPFNPGGSCGLVSSTADKKLPGYVAFVEPSESGFLAPHKDCPIWNEQ